MIGRVIGWIKKSRINKIKKAMKSIGQNVDLQYGEYTKPENMVFGSHIYVGPGAQFAADGGLVVEDGVIFGPSCVIYTSNHNYDSKDLQAVPYDGRTLLASVTIKRNTWIGGHSIILPGITIGEGCVIGAGSVVTKDVEDFAVVGGNPARVLKYRDKERYGVLAQRNEIYLKKKMQKEISYEKIQKT